MLYLHDARDDDETQLGIVETLFICVERNEKKTLEINIARLNVILLLMSCMTMEQYSRKVTSRLSGSEGGRLRSAISRLLPATQQQCSSCSTRHGAAVSLSSRVGVVAGVVLGVDATDCAGESVPDGGRFC